jgi:hypothetical protein
VPDPVTPPTWIVRGRDGDLELTAWIRPRPIAPGGRFRLELEIVPHGALRARWDEQLDVELAFGFWRDHRREVHVRAALDPAGRAVAELALARAGKHHVAVILRRPDRGGELARASFDICVGADPGVPTRELARLCPDMRPSRPR